MEQESPAKSTTSSSLEQMKQPRNEQLLNHEFSSSRMPYFLTARQVEKRPRIAEGLDEQPSSYLALLSAIQNSETQQIGTSFSRAPLFVPYGNPDHETLQPYSTLNVMLETPTSLSIAAASLGILCGPNYPQGAAASRLKRKMINQEDIALNPRSRASFLLGDQGHGSSSYGSLGHGYSLYDERYQALGLPVDPHLRMFNTVYGKGNGGST